MGKLFQTKEHGANIKPKEMLNYLEGGSEGSLSNDYKIHLEIQPKNTKIHLEIQPKNTKIHLGIQPKNTKIHLEMYFCKTVRL